jgi:hypothetical protein
MSQEVPLDLSLPKLLEWQQAEKELAALRSKVEQLKAEFRGAMTSLDAEVGTVGGMPVISRRKTRTFRGKDFAENRPDLLDHYTHVRVKAVEELDLAELEKDHPDVYRSFLSETLKPDWRKLETALRLRCSE